MLSVAVCLLQVFAGASASLLADLLQIDERDSIEDEQARMVRAFPVDVKASHGD